MKKRINVALQGGGAHGAFTWGVLDRLLEEPELEIAGVSGTSAGALNGAALKAGMVVGGAEMARANLDWVWGEVGALDTTMLPDWFSSWFPDPGHVSKTIEYSLPYMVGDTVSRMMSPYSWGPLYRNPLAAIVARLDFDSVCADASPEFFVCATLVRTGKIRIFEGDRIDSNAILASACLPTMYQAVEMDDPETGVSEAFWDGGYTGNPALFPFFKAALPDDIVVININPLVREKVPVTPPEIQNRINEISFNSSLLRELRAIDFVQRLLASGVLAPGTMKDVRVHMISDDALMNALSVATKTVAVPSLLAQLKEAGRRAAGAFLADHIDDVGKRQTADLRAMFE
ncbi:patatin [Sagittula sp. P11]|uniref:patatin-like phospholipase family protein n=1 Tax=Sagittula sp. P11 TaxID=2009329 RepID=UPI000C2CEA15|nr:patatin-like phospholipase family protein [Sagittula sp. P11]AUC55518.1 patatin [Sagittula sp. P11]